MQTVLFVCNRNAGRSQIAEAFFNNEPPAGWTAVSAGSAPSRQLNPVVVEAMKELRIDLSGKKPKKIEFDSGKNAAVVVAVCNPGLCPFVPGAKEIIEWNVEDTMGKDIETVRRIRDEIKSKVEELKKQLSSQ